MCVFLYMPGPILHYILCVFWLNLPKTGCKVVFNNFVLQKRKWMCQPECIKLGLDNKQLHNLSGFTEMHVCARVCELLVSQCFCSFWYLGILADRSIIFMCFHECYRSGKGTWLSLLPPRDDILLAFHWSNQGAFQGLNWDMQSYYAQRIRDPEICETPILFTTLRRRDVRLTHLTVMQLKTDSTWVWQQSPFSCSASQAFSVLLLCISTSESCN